MANKKLLIVSAVFPPVTSSGIHRIIRISRYLNDMGVDISVLTVDETTLPKSYKYDHELLAKVPDSVNIYRVPALQLFKKMLALKNRSKPSPPSQTNGSSTATANSGGNRTKEKSTLQKLKDTLTYNMHTPDNYAMWIYPAIKAGEKIIRENGIQNVFSSSPPGTSHVVCSHLKNRTGVNWIADFRDPWAQKRWFNPEMTPFKRRKIVEFEKRTVSQADTLIMNTPELLADFRKHYGAKIDQKSLAITNGFDPADFEGLAAKNGRSDKQIVICHTGTFYRERSPMSFLAGLRDAIRSGNVPRDRFKVKLIGGLGEFAAEVERFLQENDLQNSVEVIAPIPHRACLQEIMYADVMLIVQPVTPVQIPAKIFEYIATQKPILAVSAAGATADIVLDNKLGWWAQFDRNEEIADKLTEIHRFFESNEAKSWSIDEQVLTRFNGKVLVEQLYDYLVS